MLNMKDIGVNEIANIIKTHQTTGKGLGDKLTLLRGEFDRIESEVILTQGFLTDHVEKQELRKKVQ